MRKTLILILLFIITAGMAKGVSDTLQFHYGTSVFASFQNEQWWNPEMSWKNKYRDYDAGDTREAYLFSRSLLVWRTDAWHLAQTIETLGWVLAVLFAIRLVKRPRPSLGVGTLNSSVVAAKERPRRGETLFLCGLFALVLFAFYFGFLLLYGWLLV